MLFLKEENIAKHDFYVNYMTISNSDPHHYIFHMGASHA